jgi:hypothetical protein
MWLMRIAFWINKCTNTHSEYVILSIAFPLYQWLHERASMLHCTYSACLIKYVAHWGQWGISSENICDWGFFNVSELYLNALLREYLISGDNSRNVNWIRGTLEWVCSQLFIYVRHNRLWFNIAVFGHLDYRKSQVNCNAVRRMWCLLRSVDGEYVGGQSG